MERDLWMSPDGKISKLVIKEGIWGKKPTELCGCNIILTDYPVELGNYKNFITVGDVDGDLGRLLSIGLETMNEEEIATFTFIDFNITFKVELVSFVFNGLIYEWDAEKKYALALKYKEKGIELFKSNNITDAIHRFAKCLKIILSIPIDVQEMSEVIDGIPVKDLNLLKANLYNNLASCYLINKSWLKVISLCLKVFNYDKDNIKAHYKVGVAYFHDKNFDKAIESLQIVLSNDPSNKPAANYFNLTKKELNKAEIKFNLMVKKMFK